MPKPRQFLNEPQDAYEARVQRWLAAVQAWAASDFAGDLVDFLAAHLRALAQAHDTSSCEACRALAQELDGPSST